jgi:hypothetical protein
LSLFLFEWERLSFGQDLWEPLEVLLVPEVFNSASLSATFLDESSSEVELSVEVSLVLIGLGEEGEGKIAVDGSMAVWGLEGSGVEAKAWMVSFGRKWDLGRGGGGVGRVGDG